jgi:membrane protein DedA with SNARE-associated domain
MPAHLKSASSTRQKAPMDFEQYIQPIIEFVRLHQAWAAPIVAVLCFAESLAFISLLIPAWAALVGIGAIISASGLSFWPILIAGALGAALGDWLSYWVGLKLEDRVYHMWPLSQHPNLIPAGEAFIRKWGTAAILIARFSGPLRASVPIVAGVFAMPYWRFQIANFSSAFLWAWVLLTLGDFTSVAIKWLARVMGG